MYCYIWMVSFVCEERGYSCCCTLSVIVGEFGKGKKFGPIILLVVAVHTDVLFQCLVSAFGLSIAFWMISQGKVKFHIESFP